MTEPAAEGQSTERIAVNLVHMLHDRSLTLAVAESLTGGDVCARIVDVPGASTVLRGGVVAYATVLKARILGVDPTLLESGGPVQAEVAEQMARGVAALCGADVGLATTGVAGPGDSADGPAGLVFLGCSGAWIPEGATSRRLDLRGDRSQVRAQTVLGALQLAVDLTFAADGARTRLS